MVDDDTGMTDNDDPSCDTDEIQCTSGARGYLCSSCKSTLVYDTIAGSCTECMSPPLRILCAVSLVWVVGLLYYGSIHLPDGTRLDVGKAKVVWVAMTLIATVPGTAEVRFRGPMVVLARVFGLVRVELWGWVGGECLPTFDYRTTAYATSLLPIGVIALIWLGWSLVFVCTDWRMRTESVRSTVFPIQASIFVTYLVLPFVASVQIKSMLCTELGELGGVRFVREDSSFQCDDEHEAFVHSLIPLVVVYQCVPLAYAALLWQVRDILMAAPTVRGGGGGGAHHRPSLKPEYLPAAVHMAVVDAHAEEELESTSLLHRGYQPEVSSWWEVAECYRRMAFVAALSLIESRAQRALVGLLLGLLSVAINGMVAPYR